jgi:hypothetical protein
LILILFDVLVILYSCVMALDADTEAALFRPPEMLIETFLDDDTSTSIRQQEIDMKEEQDLGKKQKFLVRSTLIILSTQC